MGASDVIVNISNTLMPIRTTEFGRSLILSTEGTDVKDEVQLYEDIESLAADFDEDTDVYATAISMLGQTPRPRDLLVLDVTRGGTPSPTDLSGALNALLDAGGLGKAWYFLVQAQREKIAGDRDELAEWVQAQRRMFLASPYAGEDEDDLAAVAADYVHKRIWLGAHTDLDEHFDAAMAGRVGARPVGSVNWRHLMLDGVAAPEFTATQLATLEAGNVSSYWSNPIGLLTTTGGMTTSGFWADLTHSIDFIEAKMMEKIWDALSQHDKIPYDDHGILLLAALVKQSLEYCCGRPHYIIATDMDGNGLYQVTPPRRQDIDPLDAKNRILPDLPWIATAAGAINKVIVNGILTEEWIQPIREAE